MPADQRLQQLLVEHLPTVRAFVRLNVDSGLRQRESCSDVVQTVCRQLLERGDVEYRDEASFRSWLYAAVLNVVRNRARFHAAARRATERETSGHDAEVAARYASLASPSEEAIAQERAAEIERAFEQLPEQYREVVTLSRIAGLSNAQIAPMLGKTEPNVRMLLSRALARLASLLG